MLRFTRTFILLCLIAVSATVVGQTERPANKSERISADAPTSIDLTTPEAAHQTYFDAFADRRFEVMHECLTPASRPSFLIIAADYVRQSIDYKDREARSELDRIVREHGAPKSAVGFYLKLRSVRSSTEKANAIQAAYDAVRDKPGYLNALSQLAAKHPPSGRLAGIYERSRQPDVKNVVIEGDQASGILHTDRDPGKEGSVRFERHNGRWHIVKDFRIGEENRK